MIAVIGHGDGFREALGLIVDTARSDSIDATPILFTLRRNFRIAVAFAGRREKKLGLFRERQSQGIMRAQGTHFEGLDGQLQVIHWACGRSKMEYVVHWSRDVDVLGN